MTIKQLSDIIEQGQALKLISQAYTEIASAKLKVIRNQVERYRIYLENLAQVHRAVKQVGAERKMLPVKNGQTISLVITSNYHFYGSVNVDLIKYFISQMQVHPTEQIIIGKTAQLYLQGVSYNQKYDLVLLKGDYPNFDELSALVNKIKDYSQILIFFSKMKTVMVQQPTFSDITQTSFLKMPSPNAPKVRERPFIFEPELTQILSFFESQVTNLLLQQTFLESELSRTASRLISNDQAQMNADKFIDDYKIQLAQAKRAQANERILETFTALNSLKGGGNGSSPRDN